MSHFFVKSPKELEVQLHKEEKNNRYLELINLQQAWIEKNMRQGFDFATWVFGDLDFFKTPLEKSFREELAEKAKALFEEAGYTVKDPVITWREEHKYE